jgi:predicted O-methyltransferase YrrM
VSLDEKSQEKSEETMPFTGTASLASSGLWQRLMRQPNWYRLLCRISYPTLSGLFDIQSHLTDREKVTLYRLACKISEKRTPSCSLVEIGSYVGASSSYLAAGLAKNGPLGKVYCIDTWRNDSMTEGGRDTMAEFLHNTRKFSRHIEPIRGWSTDPQVVDHVKRLAVKIDLLFIDGDHRFEGVLADWKLYSPLLAKNAIVAMHDIGWAEGVQRVVAEEIQPHVVWESRMANLWWGRMPA